MSRNAEDTNVLGRFAVTPRVKSTLNNKGLALISNNSTHSFDIFNTPGIFMYYIAIILPLFIILLNVLYYFYKWIFDKTRSCRTSTPQYTLHEINDDIEFA